MSTLGNVLWFIFGGWWMGLGWWLAGLLCAVTVVGLPWAVRTAGGAKMGMVPTSNFLRHIIAEELWRGSVSGAVQGT